MSNCAILRPLTGLHPHRLRLIFFRGRGKKEAWSFFTKFTEAERELELMEKIEVDTVGQLQVFLLLKKADLLSYFEKLIGVGGDN